MRELESEDSYAYLHCYHFESLSTTVREYRTLKMVEFSEMAPIILQPSLSLSQQMKDQLLEENQKTINTALNLQVVASREQAPAPSRTWATKGSKQKKPIDTDANMKTYLDKHGHLFNHSQLSVLQKVTAMPKHDILLVQGPPGTGKTHTITGIVSMLLTSGVKRLHICAPSNAAADEIITRLSVKGLVGQSALIGSESGELLDIESVLIRLGSMEYEPSPVVKRHTMDELLDKEVLREKTHVAKTGVDDCQLLLDAMHASDVEGLQLEDKKVEEALQRQVTPNLKNLKKWLKKALQIQE